MAVSFKELVPMLFINAKAGNTSYIRGHAGIGKSQMMNDVKNLWIETDGLDEDDVRVVTINGGNLTEGVLGGIPIPVEDEENSLLVNEYTLYSKFRDIVQNDNEGKKTILFLDEFNRPYGDVQQELMCVVLDRRINDFHIPQSVAIICAGNPTEDVNNDYMVHEMNAALLNRLIIFDLETNPTDWVAWASNLDEVREDGTRRFIEPSVVEFIASFPEYLHQPNSKEEIKPTPRGWEIFSRSITSAKSMFEKSDNFRNMVLTIGNGIVGQTPATAYIGFLNETINPILTFNDFFHSDNNNLKVNMEKLSNESIGRLYLTMSRMYTHMEEMAKERKLTPFFKSDKNANRNIEILNNIFTRLPKDYLRSTARMILEKYPNTYKILTNDKIVSSKNNLIDLLIDSHQVTSEMSKMI